MERSDRRKRREEWRDEDIKISRGALLEVATQHRQLADEMRSVAKRHDEAAAYIEGLVEGTRPEYRADV